MWQPMIARFQAPRIIYIFTKTTYITRNRKSSGPRKAQAFWGEEEQRNESELCEAQETRGSKFIYEFGRNSTVYCFVASGNNVQHPLAKYVIYLDFSKSLKNLYLINSCFFMIC